jgi:hypothetical protein
MTYKKWVFTGLLILITNLLWAQAEIFNPIRDAIKAGSAKEAVKYFNQSLDISLEGAINTYSKTQAEFVLRDFFKNHPPSEFNIVHTGSSKGGLQYALGDYKSNDGTYTVLIRVKQSGNTFLVTEISFVKK